MPIYVVLAVWAIVYREIGEPSRVQERLDYRKRLVEISYAVQRRVIGRWKTLYKLLSKRCMVSPRRRPASRGREVGVRRIPVETMVWQISVINSELYERMQQTLH
jgi:hypothetical protein